MSGLTLPINGRNVREEYDENDPKQVAAMRAKFEAIAGGVLRYATKDGETATITREEFPEGQAEVYVSPQYQGG